MSWSIGSRDAYRWRNPEAGFTLIEVLVAFAVAALLLVVLSRGLGLGMLSTARVKSAEEATILAQSALDPLGVIAPLRNGDRADLDHGAYHIHVAVDRYDDANGPHADGYLKLFRLSATVDWREGLRARSLTLTTLRFGPEGRLAQ